MPILIYSIRVPTLHLKGWGAYLQYSLKIPVINKAIGKRSARSFIAEGRFQEVANSVLAEDFVVIEFGHNDGGSPQGTDNGRSACYGAGSETCTTPAGLIVQTFPTYLIAAAKLMTAKGAQVIISATTPNNPRETRPFVYSPGGFTTYARDSAPKVGGLASFVDHGQYTANIYQTLGGAKINSYFPQDHTHTSAARADVVSKTFVKSVLCAGNIPLAPYVKK